MFYELPTSVEVGGAERPIRSDFRAALDCIQIVSDPELVDDDRTLLLLECFYDSWDEQIGDEVIEHGWMDIDPRDYQEAVDRALWFIGGGKEAARARRPKLMDWEQDFPIIAAPVNRVLGFECREVPYLHWWTFLAAYNEIGDCLFANVVSIRKKKAQGKKLDKADQAFARENSDLVNFRVKATAAEEAVFEEWI
jgi:hypothetical protein